MRSRKLRLGKETIRTLSGRQLAMVAGGTVAGRDSLICLQTATCPINIWTSMCDTLTSGGSASWTRAICGTTIGLSVTCAC